MKKIFLLLAIIAGLRSYSQQNFSLTNVFPAKATIKKDSTYQRTTKEGLTSNVVTPVVQSRQQNKILGLYGIGNLNEEAFNGINSSGKLSMYIKPFTSEKSSIITTLSFNKNATNNDTLLASTVIFPEIGDHSFLGSVDYIHKIASPSFINDSTSHFLGIFAEFSHKKIKKDFNDDVTGKTTDKHFSTLNYTLGGRYIFGFQRKDFDCALSASVYLSWFNIPDEDTSDFRAIASQNFKSVTNKPLTDNFFSGGIKIAFQINSFQIFADFRHVFRKEDISARELRGFHSNIGVIFNAKIFEL
jgi:hypothetical protein